MGILQRRWRTKEKRGMYFICDGGYLRWQTLVCPYAGTAETGCRGYYNSNLVSVRKDVECTFGILKKRWRILDYGLNYYCMKQCEKVFTVCCVLHNMLLYANDSDGFISRASQGCPIGNDGLWLKGADEMMERFMNETVLANITAGDRRDAVLWAERRDLLAEHLEYCKTIRHRIR